MTKTCIVDKQGRVRRRNGRFVKLFTPEPVSRRSQWVQERNEIIASLSDIPIAEIAKGFGVSESIVQRIQRCAERWGEFS